jgi:hypothetical protein
LYNCAADKANRWFFLFGFEKGDRANIATDEKEALKQRIGVIGIKGRQSLQGAWSPYQVHTG